MQLSGSPAPYLGYQPHHPENLIYIMQNVTSDCGGLSNPVYGAVDTPSETTYGEQASYVCNTGYNLVGNSQTLCQADGNWETAPTCHIVGEY